MKKILSFIALVILLTSCGVQQFQVNTNTTDFQNGGRVFGEKTRGMKKGSDFVKAGTCWIFGINLLNSADTEAMAKRINAEHYTIETKHNFVSSICYYFTGGVINYKVVKVIKRES